MTKKKTSPVVKVFVALILIVCLLAALFVAFFYGILQYGKKRAVIIVPGLFASSLYDADTGKAVWDPLEGLDIWLTDFIRHGDINADTLMYLIMNKKSPLREEIFDHMLSNDGHGDGQGFLYHFAALNEDGTSVFNLQPYPFETESRYRYGLMNAQTDICHYFEEEYGDTYDVSVFNYDFRLDNRINGRRLQEYIENKGYDEVILVSHSNGGLVVGSYLSLSENNRKKVDKYLSFDAPYLGSITALTTLENIEDMVDNVYDILTALGFSEEVIMTAFNEQFLPLVNMFTVYQLLPTYELLETPQYYYFWTQYDHTPEQEVQMSFSEHKVPMLTMYNFETGRYDDYYFNTEDDLYEFYCSRPWAHVNNDVNAELRACMKDWLDYTRSFYIDTKDGIKHVTELVDTYYFSGIGYDTCYTAVYKKYGDTHHCVGDEFTDQGDGTVLLYSSTAGTTDFSRIVLVPFADHYDMVQCFNEFSKESTARVLENSLNWKQKILIEWNKKIRKED